MSQSKSAGFTLIEVLMVTILLFYLVYVTVTTTQELMETKVRVDYRVDLGQVQRSLWSIVDRDIRNAYYISAEDLGWNPQKPTKEEIESGNPPPPPVPPLPSTIFQGTNSQLLISTRSHQRMSQDVPENEQHYVRYVLESGKLIRSETARAVTTDDIAIKENFHEYTLLEDVKSLEFQYYDEDREKWEDAWDANRAETLKKIPGAVKFKIVFTPKVEDDPDAKPVPFTVESTIRVTQRMFKEAPFVQPQAKNSPPVR
jgi:general secretion pathway protein J